MSVDGVGRKAGWDVNHHKRSMSALNDIRIECPTTVLKILWLNGHDALEHAYRLLSRHSPQPEMPTLVMLRHLSHAEPM
jgi:hypothetical protein